MAYYSNPAGVPGIDHFAAMSGIFFFLSSHLSNILASWQSLHTWLYTTPIPVGANNL